MDNCSMGAVVSTAAAGTRSSAESPGTCQPSWSSAGLRLNLATLAAPDSRLLLELPEDVMKLVWAKLGREDKLSLFQVSWHWAFQVVQRSHCIELLLQAATEKDMDEQQYDRRRSTLKTLLNKEFFTTPESPRGRHSVCMPQKELHVSMHMAVSSFYAALPLSAMTKLSICGLQPDKKLMDQLGLKNADRLCMLTIDQDITDRQAAVLTGGLKGKGVARSELLPKSLRQCRVHGSPASNLLEWLWYQLWHMTVEGAMLTEDNYMQWGQLTEHQWRRLVKLGDGQFTISHCSPKALQVVDWLGQKVTTLRLQDVTAEDLLQFTQRLWKLCPWLEVYACNSTCALDEALTVWEVDAPENLPKGLISLEFQSCNPSYRNCVVRWLAKQLKHVTTCAADLNASAFGYNICADLTSLHLTDDIVHLTFVIHHLQQSCAALHIYGVYIPDDVSDVSAANIMQQAHQLHCEPQAVQHVPVPVFTLGGQYSTPAIHICASRMTKPGGLRLMPGTASRQLPVPAADLQQLLPNLPTSVTLLWLEDIVNADKEYWFNFLTALPEHITTVMLSDRACSCYIKAAILVSIISSLQLHIKIIVRTYNNPALPTRQLVLLARMYPWVVKVQWNQADLGKGCLPEESEAQSSWLWHPPAPDMSVNTDTTAVGVRAQHQSSAPDMAVSTGTMAASSGTSVGSNTDAGGSTGADSGTTAGSITGTGSSTNAGSSMGTSSSTYAAKSTEADTNTAVSSATEAELVPATAIKTQPRSSSDVPINTDTATCTGSGTGTGMMPVIVTATQIPPNIYPDEHVQTAAPTSTDVSTGTVTLDTATQTQPNSNPGTYVQNDAPTYTEVATGMTMALVVTSATQTQPSCNSDTHIQTNAGSFTDAGTCTDAVPVINTAMQTALSSTSHTASQTDVTNVADVGTATDTGTTVHAAINTEEPGNLDASAQTHAVNAAHVVAGSNATHAPDLAIMAANAHRGVDMSVILSICSVHGLRGLQSHQLCPITASSAEPAAEMCSSVATAGNTISSSKLMLQNSVAADGNSEDAAMNTQPSYLADTDTLTNAHAVAVVAVSSAVSSSVDTAAAAELSSLMMENSIFADSSNTIAMSTKPCSKSAAHLQTGAPTVMECMLYGIVTASATNAAKAPSSPCASRKAATRSSMRSVSTACANDRAFGPSPCCAWILLIAVYMLVGCPILLALVTAAHGDQHYTN